MVEFRSSYEKLERLLLWVILEAMAQADRLLPKIVKSLKIELESRFEFSLGSVKIVLNWINVCPPKKTEYIC